MAASTLPRLDAEEILQGVIRWVEFETPSDDGKAVNKLVDAVETEYVRLGAATKRTPGRDGYGDVLEVTAPWGGEGPGILILAHLDTVHPHGTIRDKLKVVRKGDSVYGPGIYDMKAGGYMAEYAIQHFVREGRRTPLPVRLLYVPEEEIGSPTSRARIEAAARNAKYVLVMEPARDGGKVVTARKGWGRFDMVATGRPAHAGSRHQDGRSAIMEIAQQVVKLERMTDYAREITVSVGLISGGTGANVVPAECRATIDLRVPDNATAEEMVGRILGLKPIGPDTTLTVTGGINRPPYGKNAGIAALLAHAQKLAEEIGFKLEDTPLTGGVSDGNFPAALGVPTLDGLGADGKGAHSLDEQIYFSSLAQRTALLIRMLETLE